MYNVVTKSNLISEGLCLIGKAEWNTNYEDRRDGGILIIKHSHVVITFAGCNCFDAMRIFKNIKNLKRSTFEDNKSYYLINEDGIKVHVSDDTSYKHFIKAIQHLFGLALSEIADKAKVTVMVSEE